MTCWQWRCKPDDLYIVRSVGDRWQDTARPVYTDRPAILRRFVARWVIGGILLVILAAGSRYDLPESGFFGVMRQNIDPAVVRDHYLLLGRAGADQPGTIGAAAFALDLAESAQRAQRPAQAGPSMRSSSLCWLALSRRCCRWAAPFIWRQILTAILAAFMSSFGVFRFFLTLFLMLLSWLSAWRSRDAPAAAAHAGMRRLRPARERGCCCRRGPAGVSSGICRGPVGLCGLYLFQRQGQQLRLGAAAVGDAAVRWRVLFGAYQQWQAARVRAAGRTCGCRLARWARRCPVGCGCAASTPIARCAITTWRSCTALRKRAIPRKEPRRRCTMRRALPSKCRHLE